MRASQLGSFIIWVGVVLYKVMLTAQLVDSVNNSFTPAQRLWLVAFPLYAGGTCFIVGALRVPLAFLGSVLHLFMRCVVP